MIDSNRGPGTKRPRHYAAEIIEMKSPEERRAALDHVPEEWREWVRHLVKDAFAKRKHLARLSRNQP